VPAPETLVVAGQVWRSTVSLLKPYTKAKVEAGLLWYGTRSSDEEVAVAILAGIPRQSNAKRSFDISADDLAALNGAVPDDLVVVTQIHTHPGDGTDHSPWDDEKIVSRKIFSLVFPRYGSAPALGEAGVHEFLAGKWRLLIPADAKRRLVLAPDSVDSRR
jgi:hypothetical protein